MRFNFKDAVSARVMKRKGLPRDVILQFFGGRYVWDEVEGLVTELRKRNAAYKAKNYNNTIRHADIEAANRPIIPPEVEARREHRVMLRPKTITALIFNDPLPGESALDRKLAGLPV